MSTTSRAVVTEKYGNAFETKFPETAVPQKSSIEHLYDKFKVKGFTHKWSPTTVLTDKGQSKTFS